MNFCLKHLVFTFVGFLSLWTVSAQTYVFVPGSDGQNYTYTVDPNTNHLFELSENTVVIAPSLDKLTIYEIIGGLPIAVYGCNTGNPIPSGWTFTLNDPSSNINWTYDASTNQITYTGDCASQLRVNITITPATGSAFQATLVWNIICNLTVVQSYFNACENEYLIQMNEVVNEGEEGDIQYPCRDYELHLYNTYNSQTGVLSSEVLDPTTGQAWVSINGVFEFANLPLGTYFYYVSNECGQTFPPQGTALFPAAFTISQAYNFGIDINFAGYECFEDTTTVVDLTLNGVSYPLQTWSIFNNDTNQVIYNENSPVDNTGFLFNNDGVTSQFSIENLTVVFNNLPDGNYTFSFVDALNCDETASFSTVRPLPLEAEIVSLTDVTCPDGNDGAANFTISGGWTEPFNGNIFYPLIDGQNPIWGTYASSLIYLENELGDQFTPFLVYAYYNPVTQLQEGYTVLITGLEAGNYTFNFGEIVTTNANDDTITY